MQKSKETRRQPTVPVLFSLRYRADRREPLEHAIRAAAKPTAGTCGLPLIEAVAMLAGGILRGLTLEVRRGQRWDARPRPQKMYTVPVAGAWWPAVGPRLDRVVRPARRGAARRAPTK